MGVYDNVQIPGTNDYLQVKSGPREMLTYQVGQRVPFENGVHICYEGVFVVVGGVLVHATTDIFDKWGNRLSTESLIGPTNPVAQAVEAADLVRRSAQPEPPAQEIKVKMPPNWKAPTDPRRPDLR